MSSKKMYIWGAAIILVVIILFFSFGSNDPTQETDTNPSGADAIPAENENANEQDNPSEEMPKDEMDKDEMPAPSENDPVWLSAELTDSLTGETFSIGGFDKPVLFESFAVWCPKCKAQQKELKEFHTEEGYTEEDVVSISLGTDPNEDDAQLKGHAESNGFDWHFATSPTEVTQSLIDEFGPGIVSAPSVPMVVVCPDGTFEKLDSGHKNNAELKEAVAFCA